MLLKACRTHAAKVFAWLRSTQHFAVEPCASENVDGFLQAALLCPAVERLLFLDLYEAAVRIAGIGGPTPREG